ncbi:hypothetical protein FACS1894154_12000 [Betaproteobacteria bacterium]|nr:hypothetical protein FACS1894154_12000 [Betaproteobacteria bacterium]
MNAKANSVQHDSRSNLDAISHRRAMIIKKAQERVQASHQRMRSRIRKTRV